MHITAGARLVKLNYEFQTSFVMDVVHVEYRDQNRNVEKSSSPKVAKISGVAFLALGLQNRVRFRIS